MADELIWRRNWKPDFETQCWKVLNTLNNTYLIKYYFEENLCSYNFAISDYEKIWFEEINEPTFSERAKKLNPNIEARSSYLLTHLLRTLSNSSVLNSCTLKESDSGKDQLTVCLKSKLPAGISFIWEFCCLLGEKSMIKEHLVLPLLSMVGELQRRQMELVKILEKKDYEIQEYKSSGAELPRKSFKTPTFDQDDFSKKMTVSEEFLEVVSNCAAKACREENQELYKQVMIKKKWIKFKNNPIYDEDENLGSITQSSGSESLPLTSGPSGSSWDAKLPPSLVSTETDSSPVKRSPLSSPTKSPTKISSPEKSPSKDEELKRRENLRKRLADEAEKKKLKKKRKLKI